MKIGKEKIIFLGVVFLGLVLRTLFIDKPDGLWYDEIIMYNQACKNFPFGIINETLVNDMHFPLYQILLAVWIKFFSNNDIILRLFSVLTGTIAVVFAFFAGKELKDEKLGNIFAFLTAINATLIFYSQEVKIYIMLATLACAGLWALTRIKNKNDILGCAGYVFFNTAIIYTYTIGVLYVFAQFIAFLLYSALQDKKLLKNFLISNTVLVLLFLPFAFYMATHLFKYEGASWFFTRNIFVVFVLLQNYFSPAIASIYNNPVVYIPTLKIMPVIFIYLPVALSMYAIYRSIKSNKNNLFILIIPLLFLMSEVILSYHSGFRIITRYTIMAIPPLLLLVAYGFYTFRPKILKTVISFLLIINIFFLVAVSTSAVRGYRETGSKTVPNILVNNQINDNDVILVEIQRNEYSKYLKFNGKIYSLLEDFLYQPYSFDSKNFPDKYEAFRKYIFDNGQVNKGYEKYFVDKVINPMKKESRIFFVCCGEFNLYPYNNAQNYRKYPILKLSLSKINADTLRICRKHLKFSNGVKLGASMILVFKKS